MSEWSYAGALINRTHNEDAADLIFGARRRSYTAVHACGQFQCWISGLSMPSMYA
jgi:hypothetical protein